MSERRLSIEEIAEYLGASKDALYARIWGCDSLSCMSSVFWLERLYDVSGFKCVEGIECQFQ